MITWPRWRKVAAQKIWPVLEAVVTVLCTHDGCVWHPKHVEWTCRIINRLLCVASRWTIININGHVFETLRCNRRRGGGEQSVFIALYVDIPSELCVQPGSHSRVGPSGVLIPAGTKETFLQNVQTGTGAHPAFCSVDTAVLSRV